MLGSGAAAGQRPLGRVLYDYTATASNQISLRKGSTIFIVNKGDPGGWSKGEDETGFM
jgi:hypothetical protein